jgi:hypothetical protein
MLRQNTMVVEHKVENTTLFLATSKQREREREREYSLEGHITKEQLDPLPKVSTPSQYHHQLGTKLSTHELLGAKISILDLHKWLMLAKQNVKKHVLYGIQDLQEIQDLSSEGPGVSIFIQL